MVARYVKTRVLSRSLELQVIDAYQNSEEPIKTIAKRYGVSQATITRTAKKWRIPLRNNKKTSYWEQ